MDFDPLKQLTTAKFSPQLYRRLVQNTHDVPSLQKLTTLRQQWENDRSKVNIDYSQASGAARAYTGYALNLLTKQKRLMMRAGLDAMNKWHLVTKDIRIQIVSIAGVKDYIRIIGESVTTWLIYLVSRYVDPITWKDLALLEVTIQDGNFSFKKIVQDIPYLRTGVSFVSAAASHPLFNDHVVAPQTNNTAWTGTDLMYPFRTMYIPSLDGATSAFENPDDLPVVWIPKSGATASFGTGYSLIAQPRRCFKLDPATNLLSKINFGLYSKLSDKYIGYQDREGYLNNTWIFTKVTIPKGTKSFSGNTAGYDSNPVNYIQTPQGSGHRIYTWTPTTKSITSPNLDLPSAILGYFGTPRPTKLLY